MSAMIGLLVPARVVVLAAPGTGELASLGLELGEVVEEGELVATVELREDQAELEIADASWRAAKAELDRLELELGQARDERADVEALEQFVSAAELRERRHAEALAAARKRSAGAQLRAQGSKRSEAEARVAAGQLRAPFRAALTQRFADPGARVVAGAGIVELISTEQLLRFAAPADAAEGLELELGARVEATFGDADAPVGAVIVAVSPQIDAATRLIFVEARLDGGPELRAGTVARVRLLGR